VSRYNKKAHKTRDFLNLDEAFTQRVHADKQHLMKTTQERAPCFFRFCVCVNPWAARPRKKACIVQAVDGILKTFMTSCRR